MAPNADSEPFYEPADKTVRGWQAYAGAAAICAAAGLLTVPWAQQLEPTSSVLVFVLAVVLAAARFGRGPALLTAGVSVLLLNLFFVPPRYSLAVADERFFFTFGGLLLVGLLVGQLTAGLQAQARAAREREQRMRSLYEVSRELGRALTVAQVAEAMQRFTQVQFQSAATLWAFESDGSWRAHGEAATPALAAQALALVREAQAAKPEAAPGMPVQAPQNAWLLPLRATMATRGAWAIHRRAVGGWSNDQQRLLTTCATLLAGALERIHYIDVAQATVLEVEGERLRNTLLAALSHDLRTPLASLVGLAESLRLTRPPLTGQQAEMADAIAASARRMSTLANNLLDMARLQSGSVKLDLQWQPLEEVVGAALAAMSPRLGGHRVVVALPDDLPWVHIDAVLMERVLVNLLENAVKYTPAGSVVEIGGTALADAVVLHVQDSGPGLPARPAEELFKKFERGNREGATPGFGLGLALCRAIVQAHGGRIDAVSPPAGGTRFELRLPRGTPPATPPLEALAEETRA